MDVIAQENVEKSDARKVQYNAEVNAQRQRNEESRADNAQKVDELSTVNQSELKAMRDVNQAEMDAVRGKNAKGVAEHKAWMARLQQQNKQQLAAMASDSEE